MWCGLLCLCIWKYKLKRENSLMIKAMNHISNLNLLKRFKGLFSPWEKLNCLHLPLNPLIFHERFISTLPSYILFQILWWFPSSFYKFVHESLFNLCKTFSWGSWPSYLQFISSVFWWTALFCVCSVIKDLI